MGLAELPVDMAQRVSLLPAAAVAPSNSHIRKIIDRDQRAADFGTTSEEQLYHVTVTQFSSSPQDVGVF